ncbi:hypothetical protein BDF19DRAFT_465490, partial [Syncephalis fuscata]
MFLLRFQQLILLIFIYISVQTNNAQAKITMLNGTNPPIVFPSDDVFLHPESYYHYEVVANYISSSYALCLTKEQVSKAIDNLTWQLARAGFPPVRLFILVSDIQPDFFLYYDHIVCLASARLDEFVGSGSMKTVAMEIPGFPRFMVNTNGYTSFHYTAEQEPSPWNEIFFSQTYIAYKWIYFTLVLVALLYTCVRIIMLARLKLLKRNLLLAAF